MEHLSRILVAVDFSLPARRAFDHAVALARRHAAELVAIQAVPTDEAFDAAGRAREALQARLRHTAAAAGVDVACRVQHGDAAATILLHAQAVDPDVLVLGSHQRRGFERWRLGSVSEQVVARADVPVLVVPPSVPPAAAGPFRHVAVAVDLTVASDAAVERALEMGSSGTGRITLLHVVPGFSSGVPRNLYRYGIAEYQRQLVRDARRALQLAVPAGRPSRAAIHTRVMQGDTTAELGRVLATLDADLLVVGVRRRGFAGSALIGSTAGRLLKLTGVPMLAVPAAGRVEGGTATLPLRRAA